MSLSENNMQKLTEIVGAQNLLMGEDMARYSRDWMQVFHSSPLAVVRPKTTGEVSAILALANKARIPVVPMGGNTGLVGGTRADGALIVSLERMNTIRDIRPQARIAIVEAGVVLARLHEAAEEQGLVFPLFFGARGSAMIGGNLSTNAGGSNVLRYGNTRALCLGLEVVLADGRVMNLMSELHKDNAGYDLKQLFIGAEGTLGIITAAVLKLSPQPRAYATAMLAAHSLDGALDLLNTLQEASGGMVEAFEFMPKTYLARLKEARPDMRPPLGHDHDVTILVELGATAPRDSTPAADGTLPLATLLEDTLAQMIGTGQAADAVIAKSESERRKMWQIRELAAEITMGRTPHVDFDVAVPLDKVDTFLKLAHSRLAKADAQADTISVAHLGDGNIHFAVFPSRDDKKHKAAIKELIDGISTELGGSFSAEHGIGLAKLKTMAQGKDPVALDVMRTIKSALDPHNILNPGKVLPPVQA